MCIIMAVLFYLYQFQNQEKNRGSAYPWVQLIHELLRQFRIPDREKSYFTSCFMFEMNDLQFLQILKARLKILVF